MRWILIDYKMEKSYPDFKIFKSQTRLHTTMNPTIASQKVLSFVPLFWIIVLLHCTFPFFHSGHSHTILQSVTTHPLAWSYWEQCSMFLMWCLHFDAFHRCFWLFKRYAILIVYIIPNHDAISAISSLIIDTLQKPWHPSVTFDVTSIAVCLP